MIILNSRESIFLKGIKLQKIYSFKHVEFEKFYETFKDTFLYKRKSILMAIFSLYGSNYSVSEVEEIFLRDGTKLLSKFQDVKVNNYNYKSLFYKNILESVLGELSILPIGVIENDKYINKAGYYSMNYLFVPCKSGTVTFEDFLEIRDDEIYKSEKNSKIVGELKTVSEKDITVLSGYDVKEINIDRKIASLYIKKT